MKAHFYILAVMALFVAQLITMPAQAGVINYRDGEGQWQTTRCKRPTPPTLASGSAEKLNENMSAYNGFVQASDAYIKCLADERSADLSGITNIMNGSLDAEAAALQGHAARLLADMPQQRSK